MRALVLGTDGRFSLQDAANALRPPARNAGRQVHTCQDSDPTTVCPDNALLWLGYITYPEAYLLNEDRLALMQSPFFSRAHVRRSLPDCSDLGRKRP